MNNATLWANNGVMNWQGTISLAGANTIQVDGTSLTLSGVISGTGSLTKTGANPLILSAANTYSGATNISAERSSWVWRTRSHRAAPSR
jgi:autotransporter-associated beta strand protein